jgi:hypothetical protein
MSLDLAQTDEELAKAICPGSPLDVGIARAVAVLRNAGVETYESCEGGEGHAYLEPAVRFHGGTYAGWNALSAALTFRLHVSALRRFWSIEQYEPVGPYWEITFR